MEIEDSFNEYLEEKIDLDEFKRIVQGSNR